MCKHTHISTDNTYKCKGQLVLGKKQNFVVAGEICGLVISAEPGEREGPAWEDIEQRTTMMLSGSETPTAWATEKQQQ